MASMPRWVRQSAAIPVRDGLICMVTSRRGKRWVVPKGLIDPGKTAGESALQECWEEAGIAGLLSREPVGSYLYQKFGITHHVTVFVLHVHDVTDDWPEREVRQREWLPPAEAMDRIDEPTLRAIVRRVIDGVEVAVPLG